MAQHKTFSYGAIFIFFSFIVLAEATPKTIMRTMAVKGLTLYHLKSHLQVFITSVALFMCKNMPIF